MAMASFGLPVIGWFVSPIIDKVMEHGILHFKEKWRLEERISKEIDRLSRVLPLIKGVLEDAEKKQSENSGVCFWLGELKEVLYDAEDILDRYEVDLALMNGRDSEQPRSEMGWKAKVSGHFFSSFSSRQQSSLDLSVAAKQIESIRERLDDICKRGHELGLREMATSTNTLGNTATVRQRRETTSFLADESTVVGRADVKSSIIKALLDDSKKLSVLPIIGMGGMGKTTLARLVFNDKDVDTFFKSKMWVCIGMSQDMDLRRLMIQIVNCISNPQKRIKNYDYYSLDLLQRTIVEEIKEKQPFMLVLDDAWDTETRTWNRLLEPLKAGNLTCRIIVTTRDQQFADAVRSYGHEPIPVNFLKEVDMWDIFRRHAFGRETVDVDPKLESMGRQIVQRLKGLPLAAEIVGGILYGNRDARYWRRILESKILKIKEEKNYMLSMLMLSYDSLSVLLKQCFPYFSLFPKDYIFSFDGQKSYYSLNRYDYMAPISQILYIWMSQKLTEIECDTVPNDIGSEIIVQLSNRSLLQSNKLTWRPSIMIHDLVHDLDEMIAKEEFLRASDVTENNLPKNLRHVSFFEKDPDSDEIADLELKILWDLRRYSKLRTFLFNKFYKRVDNYTSLLDGCFNSLIYIRVLSLHNRHMTSLPESIGNLKLLRYLDLHLPSMKKLPDSVSSLYSLQVLSLIGCHSLSALDDSLTRLVNLVNLDSNDSLGTLKNIGKLTNLRQLKAFCIKKQEGHKAMELKNLNKMCGSLHILNLENIEAESEAREAKLHEKDGLKELRFSWGDTGGSEEVQSDVLEGLRPSTNLNKLSLHGNKAARLPNWLNRKGLPFLKVFELHNCPDLKGIPSLTGSLEKLEIYDSPHLVEISSLPPRLQHLSLSKVGVTSLFPSWSASQLLPSIPCMQSLRTLTVNGCPNLDESLGALVKGSLPSLDSLDVWNYIHPLESFRYLTALSRLRLSSCSGKVGIDVRALVSLKDLTIEYCPSAAIEDPDSNSAPCISLCHLKITRSPTLLKSLSQSKVFLSSLKWLQVNGDDLDDSVLLGCLLGLTALEKLDMQYCPNVTAIPEEVLRTLVSMETLKLGRCERLEDLDLTALSSLKSLDIESCPRFVFKGRLSRSPCNQLLRNVRLIDFSADRSAGLLSLIEHWTTLEQLSISRCEGLPSKFPSLKVLKKLSIWRCSDVISFPALDSLRELDMGYCPNFTFWELPSMPFPSLVELRLCGFDVQWLTHLIMRVTGSPLERLLVNRCDDLIGFHGDLELPFLSLTSLRQLRISRCDHLQQLPSDLQGFKALRGLTISDCSQISSLPEEGLPVSLEILDMSGCPALEARYGQREGNPNRHRISHIPTIRI